MPAHQAKPGTIATLYLQTAKVKSAFNPHSYLGVLLDLLNSSLGQIRQKINQARTPTKNLIEV